MQPITACVVRCKGISGNDSAADALLGTGTRGLMVTSLHSFHGSYANLRMKNGDPCHIRLSVTGVVVKKSKLGLLGVKLYEEDNGFQVAMIAKALNYLHPIPLTPTGLTNPILAAFTNAALHCSTLAEVSKVFSTAIGQAERISGMAIDKLRFD